MAVSDSAGTAQAPILRAKPRLQLFISFSNGDIKLKEDLVAAIYDPEIEIFNPDRDIQRQDVWTAELQDRIENADCFLLLYTEKSSQSETVQWEYDEAVRLRKLIWVVKDTRARVIAHFESIFEEKEAIKLIPGEEESCFQHIRDLLDERFPKFRGTIQANNCPYPGVSPFGLNPAFTKDFFFGREWDIQEIRRTVMRDPHLLLLYAPSGAGKTSLLHVGLAPRLSDCWYGGPINGRDTASADELFKTAYIQITKEALPPGANVMDSLRAALNEVPQPKCVLCFDQMETFFLKASDAERNQFRVKLRALLTDRRPKALTAILSFRKEILADVEAPLKAQRFLEWNGIYLRRLSPRDALDCMVEPARRRGVGFDKALARALVKALPRDPGDDLAVSPMDIQKVCERLWNNITARSRTSGATSLILEHDLVDEKGVEIPGADIDEKAATFVALVQRHYLNTQIAKLVKEGRSADLIRVSLMQFVAPDRSRRRVKGSADGDPRKVGRLSSEVVEELVNIHLVEKCGDRAEYELVHDALAVEISKVCGNDKWVAALSRLEMELTETAGKLAFNTHSDLLLDLEPVRQKKGIAFDEAQVKFLLACALGDRRTTAGTVQISLEGWAGLLLEDAAQSGAKLAALLEVLTDALAQDDPKVNADALSLAVSLLGGAHAGAVRPGLLCLGPKILDLALHGADDVPAKACALLVSLNDAEQIDRLFDIFEHGEQDRREARKALGLVRDAVDKKEGPGTAYWTRWRAMNSGRKVSVLRRLLGSRMKTAFIAMAVIICVCAPVTGVGAAIPFMPMGYWGASLTLEGTKNSWITGIFHGMAGGLDWGLGVTAMLLLYSLVWKGGRIPKGAWQTALLSIYALIGGFLGGVLNFIIIGPVYTSEGLYHAGWTFHEYPVSPTREMLWRFMDQGAMHWGTMHGWIMPLFGAFLGPGIAWSLMAVLHDPKQRFSAGGFGSAGRNLRSIFVIAGSVLRESWRNAIWLAAGAYVIMKFVHPGPGVCDLIGNPKAISAGCDPHALLAPFWARSFGLAFIILGGSLALEIAFLFSLITVRSGFTLNRNPSFLLSTEVRARTDGEIAPRRGANAA